MSARSVTFSLEGSASEIADQVFRQILDPILYSAGQTLTKPDLLQMYVSVLAGLCASASIHFDGPTVAVELRKLADACDKVDATPTKH